jgi:hypothetical protein
MLHAADVYVGKLVVLLKTKDMYENTVSSPSHKTTP